MVSALTHRRTFLAILLGTLLWSAVPIDAQNYQALLRDGTFISGERLRHQAERRPMTLDDRPLLETENPVWVLRDRNLSIAQPRNYIEMTNGDRLIGQAHQIVTGEAALPLGDHLVVTSTRYSGNVRVRLDWIQRIVQGFAGELPPAGETYFVRLRDGRELSPRSLRWQAKGARLLTDDGIIDTDFDEIAELRWPNRPIVPPLPGAVFLEGDQPKIVRTVTSDGEVFTFPQTMLAPAPQRKGRMYISSESHFATRPPWTLDSIAFDRYGIAWQTYLYDDEMPLSLLPLIDSEQTTAVAHLKWRRNASVHGRPLQSGDTAAELGIGMHSRTKLTFALPPHASRFTSLIGFDRAAGDGGCVHARVYVNDGEAPRWEHKYFQGADGVQSVGPIDIRGAQTLTLEIDFADEGRPEGADPLDIRDWVNWLLPTVFVDQESPSFASRRHEDIGRLIPEVEGWQVSDDLLGEITIRPNLQAKGEGWRMALCSGAKPLVLEQNVRIDLTNAWLYIEAAAADMPGSLHEIKVAAGNDDVGSTMNGRIRTQDKGRFADRVHILHSHPYQDVTVRVIAFPQEENKRRTLKGVVFRPLRLQPLVVGLPASGTPIQPEVPITSLEPISAKCEGQPLSLKAGMVTERRELNVRGWNFTDGYGVPTGSEITFALDPAWKRFVAILGLADGWKGAGPYQVLVDGKIIWHSDHHYNRNHQGEQINVELPSGGKTITLKLLGDSSGGAWAHAGFLTK